MTAPDAKRARMDEELPQNAAGVHTADYAKMYTPDHYTAPRGLNDDGKRGRIIDGKAIAQKMRQKVKQSLQEQLEDKRFEPRQPKLVVVLVGDNAASKVYIRQKSKACEEVGILSELVNLPEDTSPEALLAKVKEMNDDPAVDGVLVQLPLPTEALRAIQQDVVEAIRPDKDVDGFHPYNLGRLVSRSPTLRPCTPWGVMHLIWSTGVNPYGLRCVVVGSSNHVGRPMMLELLLNGASVQIAHRFTRDLESLISDAECIVVAAGKPGLIKGEWIRPGAIVIDVGINRLPTGKLCGDVDFESAKERAGWITPVPGGVGPMTVAMLLQNTLDAYNTHRKPL
eukprot:Hpha_TRINITY_DN13922_c0_g2::TRINITY_DN13922_c0_g2_i1::g.35636::m.35636/K01491/folD; methylenetetrahydrofolate dehydrogenase (NADP+) / methenyltetrahydrofolate cyclohydrolase